MPFIEADATLAAKLALQATWASDAGMALFVAPGTVVARLGQDKFAIFYAPPEAGAGPLETPTELALARKLVKFPEAIQLASGQMRPHFLCLHLYELAGEKAHCIQTATTNADGRTDAPLIGGRPLPVGRYELHFAIGDHFRSRGILGGDPPFLLMREDADRDRHGDQRKSQPCSPCCAASRPSASAWAVTRIGRMTDTASAAVIAKIRDFMGAIEAQSAPRVKSAYSMNLAYSPR